MAMTAGIGVAIGLSAVNVVLLALLTSVWLRNWRVFGSGLLLGLVAFGSVLLLENLVAIGFFLSMQRLYAMDPLVGTVVAALRGLELVALAVLTAVTVR